MKNNLGLKNRAVALRRSVFAGAAMAGLLLLSSSGFAQSKTFTLKGDVANLPDGKVLFGFGSFGKMKADSVDAKDGKFTITDEVDEPCYGMLFNRDYTLKVDMFVDGGTIEVKGDYKQPYDIAVKGSPVVNEYEAYNQAQMASRKPVQDVYTKWIEAYNAGDSVAVETYKAQFESARDKQMGISQKLQMDFMTTHPGSIAAAWELLHYVKDANLAKSKAIFDSFTDEVKNSGQGQELAERIAKLGRVVVGSQAPVFAQADTLGHDVKLSDYKGKYVLLEFWASWCAPCRAESPNVLKAFDRYNDKGFTVLSVSLDNDKAKWMDAIHHDGLRWQQVSDLKGWKNEVATLYGINAVPANFLIDPNGKIVAQNLRGEDLQTKLDELLGQQ